MGRLAHDVCYKKRGMYWYYKIKGQNFKSSGTKSKAKCVQKANKILKEWGFLAPENQTFDDYAERFLVWETCPHVMRLLDEGKSITRRYVREGRNILDKHLEGAHFKKMMLSDIRRSHILDFRTSLRQKGLSPGSVNKIMSLLKVIFNEAEFRQDILFNPTKGVGKIKGNTLTVDIFTEEELYRLFPINYATVWGDRKTYACFFMAATTGMRQSEILALRWKNVHFDDTYIAVEEAWKDKKELGPPKWGKKRAVFMSKALKLCLLKYWETTFLKAPDDLVFCRNDGSRLSPSWWQLRFKKALKAADITTENRTIRAHSFRHTICTMLRNAGENPSKIRAALGWTSEEMQENYTHWKPEHLKNQGDIIDHVWKNIQ